MDHLKLLTSINLDFNNNTLESVRFFRSNIYSKFIWFEVLIYHYKKENLTTEQLLKSKFLSNISRPTVFKILDNAVAKGHIVKNINDKDHRKYNIVPSEATIKDYEDFAQVLKGY